MEFDELSKCAYKGEELSDLAILPTKYIYMKLLDLYDSFAKGKYTKEDCVLIKNKLRIEYTNLLKEHDRDMECHREYLLNNRKNDVLLAQLEKSNDVNEMLEVCFKIISNCVGDKGIYTRNIRKIQ